MYTTIKDIFDMALSITSPFVPVMIALAVAGSMLRYLISHGLDLDGKPIGVKPTTSDVMLDKAYRAARDDWQARTQELHAPMSNRPLHKCPYCGGNPGKGDTCQGCGAPNFERQVNNG